MARFSAYLGQGAALIPPGWIRNYRTVSSRLRTESVSQSDPVAFCKAQWDAWSPAGWYTKFDLDEAATSWKGSDFSDVVLHSYRSRWGHAAMDPKYAALQARFESTSTLKIPTLLLHGLDDRCELEQTTDGAEKYFTNNYRRLLLDGVGHFPQRENPTASAAAILQHLREIR